MAGGPARCARATRRAGGAGACSAGAPEEALRTIRPAAGGGRATRRLRRSARAISAPCENANGSLAAALYPYSVIVRDSVVGVHELASSGDIFGCIVTSNAFGDGVLSSPLASRGIASFSLEEFESSGWTRCLEAVAVGLGVAMFSLGVER